MQPPLRLSRAMVDVGFDGSASAGRDPVDAVPEDCAPGSAPAESSAARRALALDLHADRFIDARDFEHLTHGRRRATDDHAPRKLRGERQDGPDAG